MKAFSDQVLIWSRTNQRLFRWAPLNSWALLPYHSWSGPSSHREWRLYQTRCLCETRTNLRLFRLLLASLSLIVFGSPVTRPDKNLWQELRGSSKVFCLSPCLLDWGGIAKLHGLHPDFTGAGLLAIPSDSTAAVGATPTPCPRCAPGYLCTT